MSDTGSQKSGQKTPRSARSETGSRAGSERSKTSSKGDKTPRGRHNKLYRTPPTPKSEVLLEEEKGFVLDCCAVSSISSDYSKANPKLGPVVPPFNSQKDKHSDPYFTFYGVDKTMKKTLKEFEEIEGGVSIDGPVMDKFHTAGAGYQYLSMRNQFGAGHSRELVDGHSQFMQGMKPVKGYNGAYGYRRNTPWLRQMPSPFGTASRSPTH